MAKSPHTRLDCNPGCAVEATLSLIDGKWKGVILCHLLPAPARFGEIRRRIPKATQRTVTNQLRELEADGLIHREVFAQVPPKVEYSLTPLGRSLLPVLDALMDWGTANIGLFEPRRGAAAADAQQTDAQQHASEAHEGRRMGFRPGRPTPA